MNTHFSINSQTVKVYHVKAEIHYHFHHFWVIKVIDDMFQNISVRHKAQGSEHNNNWDFLFDVGQDGNDPLSNSTLLGTLRK